MTEEQEEAIEEEAVEEEWRRWSTLILASLCQERSDHTWTVSRPELYNTSAMELSRTGMVLEQRGGKDNKGARHGEDRPRADLRHPPDGVEEDVGRPVEDVLPQGRRQVGHPVAQFLDNIVRDVQGELQLPEQ